MKLNNNSVSKLWYKYIYINMNTTIMIAKLKNYTLDNVIAWHKK